MDDKMKLLKNITIFSDSADSDIELLAECCEYIDYNKGSIIFKSGDKSKSFYIVETGRVRIVTLEENDKEQVLAHFIPGEIFGEFDLFENDLRTATAIAHENSRLLVFPRQDKNFNSIYKKYPHIFVKIFSSLITVNAGRIRQTNNIVSEKSSWINDLKEQMLKDKLTGFYNKTYLQDEFPSVKERLDSLSVVIVKPDDFKIVNDTFGHEAGDTALRIISRSVLSKCDNENIAVRMRGNEFMLIYCHQKIDLAYKKAKDLHSRLSSLDIGKEITENNSLKLTFSMGLAEFPLHGEDFNTLTEIAYAKMFEQRENGGAGILLADSNETDIIPFLQTVTIFSSLYISQLKKISAYLKPFTVQKGETICQQGEEGHELFIIQTGSAIATIMIENEQEKELTIFKCGDFFGEMAIFENPVRSATCTAGEQTALFKLAKADFLNLMQAKPVIAIKIMRQMLDITSARLSKTGKFISEMVKWGNSASKRSITDELTGVYNRRYLDSALEKHFNDAKEKNKSMALIMADLDFFREVNEGYSHETGDKYIVEVAAIFSSSLRKSDIIARYGGDEFTILLPDTSLQEAEKYAQIIRERVEALDFLKNYSGPRIKLSVSLGIAVYPDNCESKEKLASCADAALYKAKEGGRNKVCIYE